MHYESHKGINLGTPSIKLRDIFSPYELKQLYKSSEYGKYHITTNGWIMKLIPSTGGFMEYMELYKINKDLKLKHNIYFNDEDIANELNIVI